MSEEEEREERWAYTGETAKKPETKRQPHDFSKSKKEPESEPKEQEPESEPKETPTVSTTSSGGGGSTLLSVVLLGAGLILVASALDNSSIVDTFHKIVSGQPIDWTGGSTGNILGQTPVTGNPAVVGGGALQNVNPDGSCPTGFTKVTVSGGKIMCQKN